MRPARKGPENRRSERRMKGRDCAFNEAGPQGAGKHPPPPREPRSQPAFNEAGPQGAGKPLRLRDGVEGSGRPSMRPARKGPENTLRGGADELVERILQ